MIAGEKQLSSALHAIRDQELERLFQLGSIEELPFKDIHECVVNDIFIVPKPHSSKFRPIIDQRFANSFTKKVHFKMESIKDVKDILQPEDLMIRIDFKDAFLHLFYRYTYRKFGAFWWRRQLWMFRSMMFGHTHAPRWWTKVMKPVRAASVVQWYRRCTTTVEVMGSIPTGGKNLYAVFAVTH